MQITNKFGTGEIYSINEAIASQYVYGTYIYCECTACMSIYSDFLSWISSNNDNLLVNSEFIANMIIVLGCQVTDLAIYNDIKTAERLHEKNPKTQIYIGGCLAQRFDIKLPEYVRRLDVTRVEYQPISDEAFELITWAKPFWVTESINPDDKLADGNLFRDKYPLKIGAGCHGKCKYCTIRETRGPAYETDALLQVNEFLEHDNIVLISDSPAVEQIKDWCMLAERYSKKISIRNLEPQNAMQCTDELTSLAKKGLLEILHVPIQSSITYVLNAMDRSVPATHAYVQFAQALRKFGVIVATNIIIDYVVDGKVFHNMNTEWLDANFDYWVWNPYFNGDWNMEKAEARFKEYITGDSTGDSTGVPKPESISTFDVGKVSDGFHTFDELYYHRAVLFSIICNKWPGIAWKSIKHNDGTCYEGYFIAGISTLSGQTTYHIKNDLYSLFKVKVLERAPRWDRHTPEQAIDRLRLFSESL